MTCFRHSHLEALAHVLDEVGGLLPVALLLVGGDGEPAAGRGLEPLLGEVPPPRAPRRHPALPATTGSETAVWLSQAQAQPAAPVGWHKPRFKSGWS